MSNAFVIETDLEQGYLHATLKSSWDATQDTEPFASALVDIFDSAKRPLWLIVDFSLSSWDLGDVVFGSNFATRTGIKFLKHDNMRELIAVGGSGIINLGVKGLSSPVFGNVPVKIVDTLEEAFNYIG